MIIFLYGQDEYRRHKRKEFYVAEYQKKHSSFGIDRFDLSTEGQFEKFQEFIKNRSIFDTFKLAYLESFFECATKEIVAEIKTLVQSDKGTTILISETKSPVKEYSFLLKKPVIAEEFPLLEGAEWESFVRDEASRIGVSLSSSAAVFFAEVHRGDSWRAATELQKLAFLNRSQIDMKDLEKFNLEISPDFWSLMNGLKSQEWRHRIGSLERMFAGQESTAKIFNILSAQWPEKIQAMANYDVMVKSGKLEYEEVLVDLAL